MLTAARLREVLDYNPKTGVFRWKVDRNGGQFPAGSVAGGIDELGYRRIKIDGKRYKAHRLAWLYMTGDWPPNDIDHKNRQPGDNRWKNLRSATESQNLANRPKPRNNSSGFKGVIWFGRGLSKPWLAQTNHHGRHIHIGMFATAEDAHKAYCRVFRKLHGEFARTD